MRMSCMPCVVVIGLGMSFFCLWKLMQTIKKLVQASLVEPQSKSVEQTTATEAAPTCSLPESPAKRLALCWILVFRLSSRKKLFCVDEPHALQFFWRQRSSSLDKDEHAWQRSENLKRCLRNVPGTQESIASKHGSAFS